VEDIFDNGMSVISTKMNLDLDLALTNGMNNSFVTKVNGTGRIKE